jgi:hypothetical protein
MEAAMGLMDILSQYAQQAQASASQPAPAAHEDFSTVASQAPPGLLGSGIAHALQGAPEGFEASVAKLFANSDTGQKTGLLQRLVQAAGPAVLSAVAGGALSHLAQPGAAVAPADAEAVTPAQAGELAGAARRSDSSIVDELGSFYSQHPALVKTLGAAALTMAMSHMAKRA